jgi:hypothetical protein
MMNHICLKYNKNHFHLFPFPSDFVALLPWQRSRLLRATVPSGKRVHVRRFATLQIPERPNPGINIGMFIYADFRLLL